MKDERTMGRRTPQKKAYTVYYEKDGIELERYTISALNQGDAEVEASNRFHRAHPEFNIFDTTVSRRVETH